MTEERIENQEDKKNEKVLEKKQKQTRNVKSKKIKDEVGYKNNGEKNTLIKRTRKPHKGTENKDGDQKENS